MTQIDRRTFLKGMGIVGGTALGMGIFNPFEASARRSVIRYGINARDIRRLDPMAGPNSVDKTVLDHVYNGLVRPVPGVVNPEQLEPDLAESWESSKDLKSWTFRLRKGVEFHKGFGEFTSDDIVFSLNRAKDKKNNRYYKSYRNFGEIEALDKYTVRIHLKKPASALSFFPTVLDWQAGMVMSRKAVAKLGKKIKSNPIGTGPFVFKEHIPQERLVLVRNENYFRGKPAVEQIILRFLPDSSSRTLAFKAGELDITEVVREQRAIDQVMAPGVVVESYGPPTVMKLHMDRRRKPLGDLRVRQAIAHAINRDEIIKFIGGDVAKPLYSVVPPTFVGGLQDVPERLKYNYDPQKAKQLLASAGLSKGFTIDPVYITERGFYRRPMELIQNQLRQVGIRINLSVIAHPAFHKKNDDGSNPLILRAATRFPVASLILEEFFLGGGKRNFSHFSGADAEIKRAQGETNVQVQKKLWGEAQIKVLEDLAAFPTHYLNVITARKSYVDLGFKKLDSALCICIPIKWNARLK
ncbi:MAG: ABC transporter substrate-binding protein [Candidatus Binatia bacterium]